MISQYVIKYALQMYIHFRTHCLAIITYNQYLQDNLVTTKV